MQATVYKVEDCRFLTKAVTQIFLSPQDTKPLEHEAGQYLKIVFPDQSLAPFSIANAPRQDKKVELHLLHRHENSRAMEIFRKVTEEKQLTLSGPFGSCGVSRLAEDKPILFMARGTGFAPIKAVIEALVSKNKYPPIHLFWSASGWRDLYLHERVELWVKELKDFKFTAVLTREQLPEEENVKYGDLTAQIVQEYPDLSRYQVYASGPEGMIYSALEEFSKRGLPRDCFYSDAFDYRPG